MSRYYTPNRYAEWNYGGGKWKLSRSKLELFLDCPRCFYLDNKLGVKRPPGFPFSINTAIDFLLKKEFDIHRAKGQTHPLIEKYGVDARPVSHDKLNDWRENFVGVTYFHPKTKMTISGAIDDLWINSKGQYLVVDYKSTAMNEKIETLEKDYHEGYKRQMEIYQWLLRNNGLKVSDTGYFIYANGNKDAKAFDGKLEFDVTLISYKGNDNWVEKAIIDAHSCLEKKSIPASSKDCDYCAYRKAVEKVKN